MGRARAHFEAGRVSYHLRRGQMKSVVRSLSRRAMGQAAALRDHQPGPSNAYPAYRMEWQTMGSLERRLRACLRDSRRDASLRFAGISRPRAVSRVRAQGVADRDAGGATLS